MTEDFLPPTDPLRVLIAGPRATVRETLTTQLRTRFEIEATADECRRLTERLGIQALESLTVKGGLRRRADGGSYALEVDFAARVWQACVISLVPVEEFVEETVRLIYAGEDFKGKTIAELGEGKEVVIDMEDEDLPELLEGDLVDVGEVVVEHLSLALDPYPRAEGVEMTVPPQAAGGQAQEDDEKVSPFAVLKQLTGGK